MNQIDTVVRAVLADHARAVAPRPDLAARATRRSHQIHHRRIVAAGATTAAVVGVTGLAAAMAISGETHGSRRTPGVDRVAASPTGIGTASATPSPTPGFVSTCPDGQAPLVVATGEATRVGDVQSTDNGALAVEQAVIQSYLIAIANHTAISSYGVGTDSSSGRSVLWIQFHGQSTVELVTNKGNSRWASFNASLGQCAPSGR